MIERAIRELQKMLDVTVIVTYHVDRQTIEVRDLLGRFGLATHADSSQALEQALNRYLRTCR